MPRFHCAVPLSAGITLSLPPGAARHVQVLRLQPGDDITLFDGNGGEYTASQVAARAAGVQHRAWQYILLWYNQQGDETTSYVTESWHRDVPVP